MTPAQRLEAARSALAVGPAEPRGLLVATGKDARDYLHRMSTQVVNGLAPGRTTYACFLTAKGHLLGEGHLLGLPDGVLLDLDPLALPETRAVLEKFVIMDEVVFEDLSETHAALPVLGPRGPGAVASFAGAGRFLHEDLRRGAPAVALLLPRPELEPARAALLGAGAVSFEAVDLEALRILGGLARFGHDMDGSRLPMEAGLTRSAISFDKGCYTGQEVVLRATVRGHLQKGLVQLALPAGVAAGARLTAGGAEVGLVTSSAETPEGRLGLGYLRRAFWAAGTKVGVDGGEAVVRRCLVEEPATSPAAAV
jgi:hypothetical protein